VEEPSASVAITGAFSYTGKYTTRLLLNRGCRIRTLTNHPERENPFGESVQVFPYNFDRPDQLRESLRGGWPTQARCWLEWGCRELVEPASEFRENPFT